MIDPMKECPRMFAATRIGDGINEGCKLERELAAAIREREEARKLLWGREQQLILARQRVEEVEGQYAKLAPYAGALFQVALYAWNFVRCHKGNLSCYISDNGLGPNASSPWAQLVKAVEALPGHPDSPPPLASGHEIGLMSVPTGWKLTMEGDTCFVDGGMQGAYVAHENARDNIASVVLFRLAKALLAAAPEPPPAQDDRALLQASRDLRRTYDAIAAAPAAPAQPEAPACEWGHRVFTPSCVMCNPGNSSPAQGRAPEHVCGLRGYNGMIDPPCPACEANKRHEGNS